MQLRRERFVSLGHGSFVRSDDVTAVEPIHEDRGPGRRALVWVCGLPEPLISSRSEETVMNDLTGRGHQDVAREQSLAEVLDRMTSALERMPAVTLRLLQAESGEDFGRLADEAQALLSDGSASRRPKRPGEPINGTRTLRTGAKRHLRDVGTG